MTSAADFFDEHAPGAVVCRIRLEQYGGVASFSGLVATVRCFEDNVLLKQTLAEPGKGRVLVVDGGGSEAVALLGGTVAGLAAESGWEGLVVNGCVRDVAELRLLPLGIKALGSNPQPSGKTGVGEVDVPVTFGGVVFRPGAMLVSDDDGIVVLDGGG